jgi:hypothetical protein
VARTTTGALSKPPRDAPRRRCGGTKIHRRRRQWVICGVRLLPDTGTHSGRCCAAHHPASTIGCRWSLEHLRAPELLSATAKTLSNLRPPELLRSAVKTLGTCGRPNCWALPRYPSMEENMRDWFRLFVVGPATPGLLKVPRNEALPMAIVRGKSTIHLFLKMPLRCSPLAVPLSWFRRRNRCPILQ